MLKTIKIFSLIVIFPILFSGCFFVSPDIKLQNLPANWQKLPFKWGVQINAYPLNYKNEGFNQNRFAGEMELAKNLGVNYCRFNLEFIDNVDGKVSSTNILYTVNDTMVDSMVKNNCEPVMVIESGARFNEGTLDDSYNLAFQRGDEIAKRYLGKVHYYQILNEISGVTIWQSGDTGEYLEDPYGFRYNKNKYERAKAWLKGLSDGIAKADPSAQRIVTGHWTWHKVISYLIQDGVNFEILGWAWFSPDGTDLGNLYFSNNSQDYHVNIAEELSKYNKELWVIESNRVNGSYDPDNEGENKQADFISSIIDNVYYNKYFKGFFIYPFIDTPPENSPDDPASAYWGLIKIKKDPAGVYQFAQPKKAYQVYQDFISTHP